MIKITNYSDVKADTFLNSNNKRQLFTKVLKQEFIRELQYLWDVANERAVARDTFISHLAQQLKELAPKIPIVGDVVEKMSSVIAFAVNRERDIRITCIANLTEQLNWQHLDILMNSVAKEALRRYESILVERINDDADEVIRFAKVGARRMLERLTRWRK